MNGKRIKVNDFKFKYGQETKFINVFGAFKYKKNNNKYVIYSYDNSKLYYGSLFIRDNELVIMLSKNDGENLINKFLDDMQKIDANGIIYKNSKGDWCNFQYSVAMKKFREVFRKNIQLIEGIYEIHFSKEIPKEY